MSSEEDGEEDLDSEAIDDSEDPDDEAEGAALHLHHREDMMVVAAGPDDENDDNDEDDDGNEEDDDSGLDHADHAEGGDDDDEITVRSHVTTTAEDDINSTTSTSKVSPASGKRGRRKSSVGTTGTKKGRSPSVAGLTIPFRTIKKAMKLDPDTPIVQNEAAIMTTLAAELFLKNLAKESFRNAKNRGRNTIRYEDIAEARTNTPSLSFLETMLP